MTENPKRDVADALQLVFERLDKLEENHAETDDIVEWLVKEVVGLKNARRTPAGGNVL